MLMYLAMRSMVMTKEMMTCLIHQSKCLTFFMFHHLLRFLVVTKTSPWILSRPLSKEQLICIIRKAILLHLEKNVKNFIWKYQDLSRSAKKSFKLYLPLSPLLQTKFVIHMLIILMMTFDDFWWHFPFRCSKFQLLIQKANFYM